MVTADQPLPMVAVAVDEGMTVGAAVLDGLWPSDVLEGFGPGLRTGPVWAGLGSGLAVVVPLGRGDTEGAGGCDALLRLGVGVGVGVLLGVGVGVDVGVLGVGVGVDVAGGVLDARGFGFSGVGRGGAVMPGLPQSARTEASQ